jgi:serine/threonine protein phosphatase PrpC
LEIHFQTDVGKRRNTNQDFAAVYVNKKNITLAILADGMGGHRAGDVASRQAVSGLGTAWEKTDLTDSEKTAQWLIQKIQAESVSIYKKGIEDEALNGMGTTIIAVALFEDQFTIANVGDSRAYILRDHDLIQITEDHSLVNELVKSGQITAEMAVNHPRKNVLTRSVGMPNTVEVDVAIHYFASSDYLLLCSDGLTNMLTDERIAEIIEGAATLKEAVQQLIDVANQQGGVDNITVLLIKVGGTAHD